MLYIKAIHIIFVVTWFSGLFYLPRLFIYTREAQEKPSPEREILTSHFILMSKRLLYGITWPSAILTIIFGTWTALYYNHLPQWLSIKIFLVACLFIYHISLQRIFNRQKQNIFNRSSNYLRIWNEVATVFLVAIVFLATVKNSLSAIWGTAGIAVLIIVLMAAIKIYRKIREKS